MTLNELLQKYPNHEQAARIWSQQSGIDIVDARFEIAVAAGTIDGDVFRQSGGVIVPEFPLSKTGKP